jgi:hypothetical protein
MVGMNEASSAFEEAKGKIPRILGILIPDSLNRYNASSILCSDKYALATCILTLLRCSLYQKLREIIFDNEVLNLPRI